MKNTFWKAGNSEWDGYLCRTETEDFWVKPVWHNRSLVASIESMGKIPLNGYKQISKEEARRIIKSRFTRPTPKKIMKKKTQVKLVIPEITKFKISYQSSSGPKEYTVVPIEKKDGVFTAYCFGEREQRIRSFRFDKILNAW